MMKSAASSLRRLAPVGVAVALVAVGLGATFAPVAVGAGENIGTARTGPAANPEVAKKDRRAVVDADGTLVRGKGAVSVTHTAGSGSYIVFFNKNVRNCTYVATIGLSGSSGTSLRGFITTVGAAAGEDGVFVTTDDTSGVAAERGFHLYVAC